MEIPLFFLLVVQMKLIFYFLFNLSKEFKYFFPEWSFKLENMSEIFVKFIIINCSVWLKKCAFLLRLAFLKSFSI